MSERLIVFFLACAQFVTTINYVMVIPLAPEIGHDLSLATNHLAWITAAYSGSAACCALLSAAYLDRLNRTQALSIGLALLGLTTLLSAEATQVYHLYLSRALSGLLAGPISALCLSLVADSVPPERRGRAMGALMSAYAAATILGIPFGLELAEIIGWRRLFILVSGLSIILSAILAVKLPKVPAQKPSTSNMGYPFLRKDALSAYFMVTMAMFGSALINSNFSAYFQYNLHFPRAHLGELYLFGGLLSFFVASWAGRWVDSTSAARVGTVSMAIIVITLAGGYLAFPPLLPAVATFTISMAAFAVRTVAVNSLSSKVPASHERGRFMSIQVAVQYCATTLGALLSAQMLSIDANNNLVGMPRLACLAILSASIVPVLLYRLEKRVTRVRRAGID